MPEKCERRGDLTGLAFVSGLGFVSFIGGLVWSVRSTKQSKDLLRASPTAVLPTLPPESPSRLALRALGAGTALSLLMVGSLAAVGWLVLGRPRLTDVGTRLEAIFPKFDADSHRKRKAGRSDFESFRELFKYLEEADGK
uniref:Transmembrane protein 242 n=1 Tax=Schistocephalus solidus TaxID=70667 RepID=A0A0V0J7L4_SCHSO